MDKDSLILEINVPIHTQIHRKMLKSSPPLCLAGRWAKGLTGLLQMGQWALRCVSRSLLEESKGKGDFLGDNYGEWSQRRGTVSSRDQGICGNQPSELEYQYVTFFPFAISNWHHLAGK